MVREGRMSDGLEVSLWEMTIRAIVCRPLRKALCRGNRAALIRVTSQTFGAVIGRRFLNAGLRVWIVAADAVEASLALSIAAAQYHGSIVLQQIISRRRLGSIADPEDSHRFVQRRSRTKVEVVLARL